MAGVAALATSPPPDLRSSFRPTYNLAVNLVRRYRADQAHYLLDRSFAQFLDSRHHHALSRRLDRAPGPARALRVRRPRRVAAHRGAARSWPAIYHESDLLVAEALRRGALRRARRRRAGRRWSRRCTFETRPGARRC